ncbi:MAG: DUF192 domain-containing protein [Leptolyngbyaceae cyanobacterium bins.349]|nr:DUF192 domain-containing protein [Leptolyngbyaceae cyanobacterium bins.349]
MKGFAQTRQTRQRRYAAGMVGVAIALGVGIMGCSSSGPSAVQPETVSPDPSTTSDVMQVKNVGQSLPLSASVKVGEQVIQLEVATTPEQQAMGLMYRPQLEPNRGMLFPFNPPRPVNFWMKNVLINLDMVFLRDGKVIAIANNVPPCKTEPCPFYGPEGMVDQVIELRGGRAKELGIKSGDRLIVQSIN